LLLAFPTFVQQAVQISGKESKYPGPEFASMPRATDYSSWKTVEGGSTNAYFDEADLGAWYNAAYMDVYLKSAIEAGLLAAEVTHDDVAGHCGTEKCSWEPFHTLAVCSKVEDADDMLSFEHGKVPRVLLGGDDIDTGDHKLQAGGNFNIKSKFFAADRYVGNSNENYTKVVRLRPTPNNTDTNVADLAQVYLAYFDPCIAPYSQDLENNWKAWRAHKATFSLCVQTHNTSYNASGTHTTILSNNQNLKWSNETVKSTKQYCTQLPDSNDRFCLEDRTLEFIGGQLALTLDTTAYWGGRGDHYSIYSIWSPNLGSDVLGRDPGICSSDESRGIKGYERRMKSIATSLSNA
jgi:hypothetical protein